MMPEPTTVATRRRGAKRFCGKAAAQIEGLHQPALSCRSSSHPSRPMSRNLVPSDSLSIELER